MALVLTGLLAFFVPRALWAVILLFVCSRVRSFREMTPADAAGLLRRNAVYLVLPGYALLTSFWAIEPEAAAKSALKFLFYVPLGILVVFVAQRVPDATRTRLFVWSGAGLCVALIAVLIDVAAEGGLSIHFRSSLKFAHIYNRGAAVLACIVLPNVVALWRTGHRFLPAALTGLAAITIFVLASEAAKLAVVCAAIVLVLVCRFPGMFRAVVALALISIVAMPALFASPASDRALCSLSKYQFSAVHRVLIYEFSVRTILERPVVGWGMNSSRSVPNGKARAYLPECDFPDVRRGRLDMGQLMPLHPHNGALQTWLELGAIGIVLLTGTLGLMLYRAARRAAREDLGLVAGVFTSGFIIFNTSFGMWQSWLWFAAILTCAYLTLALRERRPPNG